MTTIARPTAPWQRKAATDLLTALGAAQSSRMRFAIIAWQAAETGWTQPANRNLWNTFAGGHLVVYPTVIACVKDAARLLTYPKFAEWAGYDHVAQAARLNDPMGFMEALCMSKWDLSRYGYPKENHILAIYTELVAGLPGHWFEWPT